MFHSAVQSLIRNRCDHFHIFKVIGKDRLRTAPVCKEPVRYTLQPLLPDGDTWRQDQAGLAQTADQFDPKRCLPGSRRGNYMQLPVREILLRIGQHSILIIPPCAFKLQ